MKNKLIILDRDGVINQDSDNYIKNPNEWVPLPGSLKAIAKLNHAGYLVAVATNQSGITRGLYNLATLDAIHDKFRTLLKAENGKVDMIVYCPHGPDDNCDCRKPKPGMYQQIAKHFDVDLNNVPVIGDSARDLEAANVVSALPILVRTGKGERTLTKEPTYADGLCFANLTEAVDYLLGQNT